MDSKLKPYTDDDAEKDMARIVAQVTSGFWTANPEKVDYDLARELLAHIEKSIQER